MRPSGTSQVRALLAACLAVLLTLSAQAQTRRNDRQVLDSLLRQEAGDILVRYTDTFYARGLYLDSAGNIYGVSANTWPDLAAGPDEFADSLHAGMLGYLTEAYAAATLVDRLRPLDPDRSDSTFAIFHFEDVRGTCYEARRRYEFTSLGRVIWGDPEALPCVHHLWKKAPPAQ